MSNPMPADRIRRSAGHRNALAADLAAQPSTPSGVTRTIVVPDGLAITVDDDHDTRVEVTRPEAGRARIAIRTLDHPDGIAVDVSLFTAARIVDALNAVTGTDVVAPITGSR